MKLWRVPAGTSTRSSGVTPEVRPSSTASPSPSTNTSSWSFSSWTSSPISSPGGMVMATTWLCSPAARGSGTGGLLRGAAVGGGRLAGLDQPGQAGPLDRLLDRPRHRGRDPAVEHRGDDQVGVQLALADQLGDGPGGGRLHVVGDAAGPGVEQATEEAGEHQH